MRAPNLAKLNDAVNRARQEQYRPPTPQEGVRAILPLSYLVEKDHGSVLWRTVTQLRAHAPEVYDAYLGERFLAQMIVDVVAASEAAVDWRSLVASLERRATDEGEWLVAVPLANVLPPDGYVAIADDAGIGMTLQDRDWRFGSERPLDPFEIHRHLGDRIAAGVRWRRDDQAFGPLDTRRTAVLYLVQPGTQAMALSVATSRARYALAMWSLLRQPQQGEIHPALADWEPRPYLEHAIEHKLYEPGKWTGASSTHGRSLTEHGEYHLPRDSRLVAAPFRALELAEDRLGARAVLGAAWNLYLVEREPRDFERTDELLLLSSAIESLCDLGQGASDGSERRWARITERLGLWRDLRASYDQRELEDAKQLVRDIRNISAHGSDSVLVNLGYPRKKRRALPGGREVSGHELALARAAAALPVLRHAVRGVAARSADELVDRDFDDAWFTRQFDPP